MRRLEFLIVAGSALQSRISAEAKLVWGAIYFLARPTGICEAAYQEIGDMVGLRKRAVMGAIPELTDAGLIDGLGGGNGKIRKFAIPESLQPPRFESGTGSESEPVQKQNRSRNCTGPLPKSDCTATKTAPLYKEEINNNKKSASNDAESPSDNPTYREWRPAWEESPNHA